MPIVGKNKFPWGPNTDHGQSAIGAFSITPSNTDELPFYSRAIYVGTTGDLTVIMLDDSQVTFFGIAEGVSHPLRVKKVLTSSTASNLVALY